MVPIVIVDDAREDLLLAQRVLITSKIVNPIHLLSGGKECLDYFAGKGRFSARTLPCLLILDLVMNPISGLEVLRRLRKTPEARDSVLVMLSGLTDIRRIQQGYQLGASTFLIKPLIAEEIVQMLTAIRDLAVVTGPRGTMVSIIPSQVIRVDPEVFQPPVPPGIGA